MRGPWALNPFQIERILAQNNEKALQFGPSRVKPSRKKTTRLYQTDAHDDHVERDVLLCRARVLVLHTWNKRYAKAYRCYSSLVLVHWSIALSWYPFCDLSDHLPTGITYQCSALKFCLGRQIASIIHYLVSNLIKIMVSQWRPPRLHTEANKGNFRKQAAQKTESRETPRKNSVSPADGEFENGAWFFSELLWIC